MRHHGAGRASALYVDLAVREDDDAQPTSPALRFVALLGGTLILTAVPLYWALSAGGASAAEPQAIAAKGGGGGDAMSPADDDDPDDPDDVTTTSGNAGTTNSATTSGDAQAATTTSGACPTTASTTTTDAPQVTSVTNTTTSGNAGTTGTATSTNGAGGTSNSVTNTTTSGNAGTTQTDTTTAAVCPAPGQPGADQPGAGQPGAGQPGAGQPGVVQPGAGQPGQPGQEGQVLGEQQVRGAARFTGPRRCVNRSFRVRVTGRQIRRVTFSIDGQRYRSVTRQDATGAFSARINPRRFSRGVHRVVARVTFVRGAGSARAFRIAFQRCPRPAQQVEPRFAG